jgi:hypothetical protein
VNHRRYAFIAMLGLLALIAKKGDGAPAANEPPEPSCLAMARAAVEKTDSAAARLRLALCERASGRLTDALRDARAVAARARAPHPTPAVAAARRLVKEIEPIVPTVTIDAPGAPPGVVVMLDGRPLEGNLGEPVSIDPGRHTVRAEATAAGAPLRFERSFQVAEGENVSLAVALSPLKSRADVAAPPCGPKSRGPEDVHCREQSSEPAPEENPAPEAEVPRSSASTRQASGSNVDTRIRLESSAYWDTNAVAVLSPSVSGSIASPTAGWNIGAGYLVDVVSAASPDVVSEASPPFHEVRQAGTVTAGYKPRTVGVQASGNVSREPDYLSVGGGAALTVELDDKLVVPRLGVNYSHDTIGRMTTPFSVFHHTFQTVEFELATTFVLSARSVLVVGGTLQIEEGDQSKPYRYIPMFEPATAAAVRPGQSIASVNLARESIRPLEQLPLSRERYAIGLRLAHRFGKATLRAEERVYADSWRQLATTTDLRLPVDLGDRVRFWPHARVHVQTGAFFYRLAYSPAVDATNNSLSVPQYRTDDHELSPMLTVTGGAGIRFELTSPSSADAVHFALTVQGDVAYSRFFQSLFELDRTAIYSTLGIDGEFQ